MAADLKVIHGAAAFRVIGSNTVVELNPAIKNHLCASPGRCVEIDVDHILQHLRYYAFPAADIGLDGVCDRSAFVIDMTTDGYLIADLKRGGIYTPDFCLGVNSENPGIEFILDCDGIGAREITVPMSTGSVSRRLVLTPEGFRL